MELVSESGRKELRGAGERAILLRSIRFNDSIPSCCQKSLGSVIPSGSGVGMRSALPNSAKTAWAILWWRTVSKEGSGG